MRYMFLTILVVCISFGMAHADTWTGWANATPYPYSGSLDWPLNALVTLPLWDPASYPGMSLLEAQVQMDGELFGENTWHLADGIDQQITMYQEATIDLLMPGGGPAILTIVPTQTNIWYGQNAVADGTQTLTAVFSGNGSVTGAGLSSFIGTGTVDAPLDSTDLHLGLSYGSGGTTFTSSFAPEARADVQVRYRYLDSELVPEPGTFALMGLGLLAGGLILKRRRDA